MDNIWGLDIAYAPDYWPFWLTLASLLVVAVVGALVIHGVLRVMLRPKNAGPQIEHKTYLYPGAVRAWHWCNALLFILLLLSGITNHFSLGPVASMVTLHKICGFALILSWVAFIALNKATNNQRHYRTQWQDWPKRAIRQARFYLFGIMKGESHPFPADQQNKFNPIQQVTYSAVMYGLVPLLLLSGLACLYPHITGHGFWLFRLHQALAIIGLIFIAVHVYLCTTGDTPTQTFKSMVDGYHRHQKPSPQTSEKD